MTGCPLLNDWLPARLPIPSRALRGAEVARRLASRHRRPRWCGGCGRCRRLRWNRLHPGDLNVPVIGHQLDPGTARAPLAGYALALAGAADGQVQLGIDVAVLGRGLQLKACALGYGEVDGAVAVVNL